MQSPKLYQPARVCLLLLLFGAVIGACDVETQHPQVPAEFQGFFHLDHVADAHNLELRDDGTYLYTVDGCDVRYTKDGRWVLRNGSVVFPYDENAPVIHATADGFVSDGELFVSSGAAHQTWLKGAICASCGLLGPDHLQACEVPFGFNQQ